jgi:hypothetical protein
MDKIDAVAVNLRIDDRLRQQLMAAAKRSVLSFNGEIIFRLRRSLGRQNPRRITERDDTAAAA